MVTTAISHATQANTLQPQGVRPKANAKPNIFNKILLEEKNKIKHEATKLKHSKVVSKEDVRTEIRHLRKTDRALQQSYNNTLERVNSNEINEDGMKIALKELAKKFENQFTSILWHKMFKKDTGSLGERLWSSERTRAFVELDDELGEIGEHVYEELLEEMKIKNMIGGE